jgi:hypothetical protein
MMVTVEVNGNYTLKAEDTGKELVLVSGPATITVPAGLPVGFKCGWLQLGGAVFTFAAAAGVSILNMNSHTKAGGTGARGEILCPRVQNIHYLTGNTAP